MKLWPQFLKRCPAVSAAEIQFKTYVMMFLPNSSHHSIYLRTIFQKVERLPHLMENDECYSKNEQKTVQKQSTAKRQQKLFDANDEGKKTIDAERNE